MADFWKSLVKRFDKLAAWRERGMLREWGDVHSIGAQP